MLGYPTMAVIGISVSLALLGWAYLLYPIVLRVLRAHTASPPKGESSLRVCVIIVTHNAERWISQKVRNTRELSWPRHSLDILVASDGSTDRTVALAQEARGPDVRIVDLPERVGKHRALEAAVQQADADIIVFTDVTTEVAPDAIRTLVRWFQLPDVGCVSGLDRPLNPKHGAEGESLYVHYEMWLRSAEAQAAGSMISASGCLFAVRKELCEPWASQLTADFAIPLAARERGYRVMMDPSAIARYPVSTEPSHEFERKVRTVLHGLRVLWRFRRCLSPLQHPLLAYQLVSHKLLRWASPFLVLQLLFCGLWLATASIWAALYLAFSILVVAAVVAWIARLADDSITARRVTYVLFSIAAIMVAWVRFLLGTPANAWRPSHR